MLPTVDELLAAMQGHYDPQHPRADILRPAWLLAKFRDWFSPGSIAAVYPISPYGPGMHIETGTEAFAKLDVDLAVICDDALVDRIAEAVDDDKTYAMAVGQLAISWSVVADAQIQFGHCGDKEAENRLMEAVAEYEEAAARLASRPPASADSRMYRL